jgi:tetratricopeptide (TPR) repeat protein
MRARMRTILTILILVLSLPAFAAGPLTAEQREQGRLRYDAATRKFDLGKYDEAAEDFEAAYQIVGDPVILFNIAQSMRLAQKYEKALLFYRSYLRKAANPKNRGEVEKRIAEMSEAVERQKKISEAPPVGTLRSDEKPFDPAPARVAPESPPLPSPASPPSPPSPRVELVSPPRGLRYAGYALGGLTVASLAVGAAMSALAGNANDEVQRANNARGQVWTPALQDQDATARTYDTVAIASYVVAGAFAVATTVTLVLGFRKPRAVPMAQLAPMAGPGLGGLAVTGAF